MARLTRRRLFGHATLAASAVIALPRRAWAQSAPFPSRPIRILVGFAAGGGNDLISRILAQKLHMAAELFLFNAGIRMTHIPYRGEAPAIADVLAGQVPLVFSNVSVSTGHVKSGALRALAVTSPQRAPGLPDVPTLAESGVPGSSVETWFGLTAPTGTPRDILQRLNAEVRKALAAPELQGRFAELSLSVTPSSPEELDALIKSESVRWGEVIRRAGIKAPD